MIKPSADKRWDKVTVLDNGGKSADRYTVVIDDKAVYTMSADPLSPQGVNQFACEADKLHPGFISETRRIDNDDLPDEVKVAIQRRSEGR